MCRRRRGPPGRIQALLPGTDCPAPRNPPDHHVVHRHDLMQSRGADRTEAEVNSLAQSPEGSRGPSRRVATALQIVERELSRPARPLLVRCETVTGVRAYARLL